MIGKNYFSGAYIDQSLNKIVLPSLSQSEESNSELNTSQITSSVIKCSCCGANNQIVDGAATDCEYCFSPLSKN